MPQHFTPPFTSAHVYVSPPAICCTPLVRPATCTGTELLVVELLPSWPCVFEPQHIAAPLTIAHVWMSPAPTPATPLDSPITGIGSLFGVGPALPLPSSPPSL